MGKETAKSNEREAGMMTCIGFQGVGKTYENMQVITLYGKDKIETKVRGRKSLIVDSNGEYTKEQFAKNGHANFSPKRIAISDVEAWCKSQITECRRIDTKGLPIKDKKAILEYLIQYARGVLLVIEDINTYILSLTHMEEIVGGLVNLRHRGVDVLISYQRLRAVEPLIYSNSRWIRLHYTSGRMEDVKGKIDNFELYKIAQIVVNNRYSKGDKRFFIYISNGDNNLVGQFSKEEFIRACKQYLNIYKKEVREYEQMYGCSNEEAINGQVQHYIQEYYGN
jgi:hypothetical protein